MKTAWGIFARDLKALVRSPGTLAVIVGAIVLSSACAWFSIAVLWSPDSHISNLKVAVVNDDAGVAIDDIVASKETKAALFQKLDGSDKLNIGDILVASIQGDESLDWQFVDAAQGEAGLASGEYYAEFVLPEGFTSDFLNVLSGELDRPTVEYWVNEKYEAAAHEATDAGTGAVDSAVDRAFSVLAADSFSQIVKGVAADLATAGTMVAPSAKTGLAGASSDIKAVTGELKSAADSIDGWRGKVSSAQGTLDALKADVPDLRKTIEESEQSLSDARATALEVNSSYSRALAQGSGSLGADISDIADRIAKASSTISSKQSEIDSTIANAKKSLSESERLINALRKIDPDSDTLADLEEQNGKLQDEIADMEKASQAVGEAAGKASDAASSLSEGVDKAAEEMKDRSDTFNSETLPKLGAALDSLSLVVGSLHGALGSLEAQADQAKALLEQLDGVLQKTEDALGTTDSALDDANESIVSARSDLAAITNSKAMRQASRAIDLDSSGGSSLAASPTTTEFVQAYPFGSNGASVAPFYASLAIWLACLMLVVLVKPETDPRAGLGDFPGARPWHGRVGRVMLLVLLALLQGVVVAVGDLVLGVRAAGPVSLVVACLLTSLCFVCIVYALVVTFKHVGTALAFMLFAVQVPVASGMLPAALWSDFLQGLLPWLPFTYGMGAMREAIGGFYDGVFLQCLAWLAACGIAVLLLALLVRPRILSLSRKFGEKLAAADVFFAEGQEPVEEEKSGLFSRLSSGIPSLPSLSSIAPVRREQQRNKLEFSVPEVGDFNAFDSAGDSASFIDVVWGSGDDAPSLDDEDTGKIGVIDADGNLVAGDSRDRSEGNSADGDVAEPAVGNGGVDDSGEVVDAADIAEVLPRVFEASDEEATDA